MKRTTLVLAAGFVVISGIALHAQTPAAPGIAVFVIARKMPDGSVTAARLYGEKDGVKPPM